MRLRTANTRFKRAYRAAHKGIGPNRWKGPMRKTLERYHKRQQWRTDRYIRLAPIGDDVKLGGYDHPQNGGPMHYMFLRSNRSQAT